ncbi:MAG: hypothetical protein ACM3ZA_00980 [Bacillota bacterium]
MSDYVKTNWVEGGAPGISAAQLNRMEDGIDTAHSELDAHLNDAAAAHPASAISVAPAGSIASTDVQAALQELDSEKLPTTGKAADSAKLNGYVQNTAAVAGTIPVRDAAGKVTGSITGDADTLDGKHASAIADLAQGILTDIVTINYGVTFTKQVTVPAGARQGMLVLLTKEWGGGAFSVAHTIVFGAAPANAADHWSVAYLVNGSTPETYTFSGLDAGANLGHLLSSGGTKIGRVRNVYVSNGVLYFSLYSEYSPSKTIEYTVAWMVM